MELISSHKLICGHKLMSVRVLYLVLVVEFLLSRVVVLFHN